MTSHQEEMVALHALRMLSPEEVRLLESESRYDARMRETLEELEDTAAEIARLLPEEAPPEELRAQLLTRLKTHVRGNVTPLVTPVRLMRSPLVAWAAAAAIAVGAWSLWSRNHRLGQQVTALRQVEAQAEARVGQARAGLLDVERKLADATNKISSLSAELEREKKSLAVANMRVAMLRSSIKRYEEGTALVVWNQEKQEGLLKLENMPPVQPNKDYQLWVICKQCQHPVNAGIVKVNDQGVATITFKPAQHIAEALKFAISVEAEGGVPVKSDTGPIVLVSR